MQNRYFIYIYRFLANFEKAQEQYFSKTTVNCL